MAVPEGAVTQVLDLFSGLDNLSTRAMFGGHAIYCDGTIFALLMSDGRLFLKGAGAMCDRFEALGMPRWVHVRPDGAKARMPYWELPADGLDDPEAATTLAREALAHL